MKMAQKKTLGLFDISSMTVLSLVTLIFIFPFYWVVTGSFKTDIQSQLLPPIWWPTQPTLVSYFSLFKNPVLKWFGNSFIISLATMALVCVVSSMAGYVLAKKRFYGKALIFTILVSAMALPKQVVLVPLVQLIGFLGFKNTLWACILPAVGWPFGVFLMKQFSETLPGELLEAAKIDGCTEFDTFIRIVLPIVKPGVAALAIFTFISSWNDYFLQLIMLTSRNKLTLQLGIATMQSEFSSNYGQLMAGATIAAIPIVLVFFLFQKSFTQGITMGAVKG